MRVRLLFFSLLLIGIIQLAKCNEKTSKWRYVTLNFAVKNYDGDYDRWENTGIFALNVLDIRPKQSGILVCGPSGEDGCRCDYNRKSIDCNIHRRKTILLKNYVEPFKTANITIGTLKFSPRYVYLPENQIESITQDTLLFEMGDSVEGIDLSYNQINFIGDKAFDNMVKLEKLRLNNNFISLNEYRDGWLTEELGRTLIYLNLAHNNIKLLTTGVFGPLHNLRNLNLNGNIGLVLTDSTFGRNELKELETLSLSDCGLKTLPSSVFENLPNLQYLDLIGNKFNFIPSAIKLVPKLNTLDLSRNKEMYYFQFDTFKDFPKIESLFLREMPFNSYTNCAFCGLTELQVLDLTGSKNLQGFDENAFGFKYNLSNATQKLKEIRLENCNFKTLNNSLFHWPQLETFKIGNNPWDCSQDLQWILDAENLRRDYKTDAPVCAEPEIMKGLWILEAAKRQAKNADVKRGQGKIGDVKQGHIANGPSKSPKNYYITVKQAFLGHLLFYTGITVFILSAILTVATIVIRRQRHSTMFVGGFNNLMYDYSNGEEKKCVVNEDEEDEYEYEEEYDDRPYPVNV